MDDRQWEQVAATTGIVFVALIVATYFLAPTPPKADATSQEILQYFSDNRTQVLTQSFLGAVAAGLLLWFGGSLRSFLMRAEGGTGRLAGVAFGGAVATAVVALGGTGLLGTVASRASGEAEALTTDLLFDIQNVTFTLVWAPVVVMVAATSFLGFHKGAVPAWLTWSGFALAAAGVVATAGIFDVGGPLGPSGVYGIVVFFAFALWTLATAVVIFQRLRQMPSP
jgi:hypothetical protein